MKKRYKILIVILILIALTSFYSVAYSYFSSNTDMNSTGVGIAKFIFNTDSLDEFQLSLTDLKPGDTKEYDFSVNNNILDKKSDVTIQYQITLKTYHLMPININLYKVNETNEEIVMTCDESYDRNDQNELVCSSPIQEITYSELEGFDAYKLKVDFPSEYDAAIYSELVDYLTINISSWQKVGE